jgi:hypothetical protein
MYISSLKAMEYLLEKVNEDYWCNWIRKDIKEWETNQTVDHHMSAYGGMGSFNDVVICTANQHTISKGTEEWADQLFNWLKSLCFAFAKTPDKDFTLKELEEKIGYHDASLSAFVDGENAPRETRRLFENKAPIRGWRCMDCGHGEIDEISINYYLAQELLPSIVFKACIERKLKEMIDNVLLLKIDNLDTEKQGIVDAINLSNISIVHERKDFMCPCPLCTSDNTAVYRWDYTGEGFKPGRDNLPVKEKRKKWWKIWQNT